MTYAYEQEPHLTSANSWCENFDATLPTGRTSPPHTGQVVRVLAVAFGIALIGRRLHARLEYRRDGVGERGDNDLGREAGRG